MSAPPVPAVGTDEWLCRVAALTRAVILETWHARSCVASTRVGADVLAYYGVPAEALPVLFTAFAPETYAWHTAHPDHEGPAPVGWSVGVDGAGDVHRRNWNGHLVLRLPGRQRWLDLSIDQASRPEKNLVIEEPQLVEVPDGYFDGDAARVLQHTVSTGVVIAYGLMHGEGARRYRDGRDWRGTPQRRAAVGRAIQVCRREGL